MNHAPEDKNISDYNSFWLFEDTKNSQPMADYDELNLPVHHDVRNYNLAKSFLILFVIIVFGLSVHPVLSYTLKTPYPLVIITENSMNPIFAKDDIILVKGIIHKSAIKVGDLVVYNPDPALANGSIDNLLVRQVISLEADQVIVRGASPALATDTIFIDQIIGLVAGPEQTLHLPFLGKIGNLFKK